MSETSIADEIGTYGERYFDLMISETRLILGKLDPDRFGKDRILEDKLASRDEAISFDKRAAPLSCAIQIKTILADTKDVSLSLSVAERLMQSGQPAFLYVLRLDERRRVSEARVFHILDSVLARILKRLRKDYARGATTTHDKTLSFRINQAERIDADGPALESYLRNAIGRDMDAYIEKKARQKLTLGYDGDQRVIVQGSVVADNISEIVDGLLGLRPLEVERFVATEMRFGISLPMSGFPVPGEGAVLTITPDPASACQLVIESLVDGRKAEIDCDVIRPPSMVPAEHFKMLVRAPFVQATLTRSDFKLQTLAEWARGQEREVDDWILYSSLIGILAEARCRVYVRAGGATDYLGEAQLNSGLDVDMARRQLDVIKAFGRLRVASDALAVPIKIDDILESWSPILEVDKYRSGVAGNGFKCTVHQAQEELPTELDFCPLTGFSVGREHYAYAMRCRVTTTKTGEDVVFEQNGPFSFMDVTRLDNFEDALERYRSRLLRVAGLRLCLVNLTVPEDGDTDSDDL